MLLIRYWFALLWFTRLTVIISLCCDSPGSPLLFRSVVTHPAHRLILVHPCGSPLLRLTGIGSPCCDSPGSPLLDSPLLGLASPHWHFGTLSANRLNATFLEQSILFVHRCWPLVRLSLIYFLLGVRSCFGSLVSGMLSQ